MKTLSITFLLFISAFFTVNAQDLTDPVAKKILAGVSAKFNSATTIKADFIYTLENKEAGLKVSQPGKLWVKGDKYKVGLEQQEIICDSKNVWTYLKDMEEATLSEVDPLNDEFKPSELFTIYEKDFDYIYKGEEVSNGKTMQVIDLSPKDKNKPYYLIRMAIDKKTSEPLEFKLFEKSGNRYTYTIKTLKLNSTMDDSQFTWNKPASIEVIDLR
jgi:outer membrane lipoprotein carrier protein